MFFIASDFTSITSHIHSWVFFLLWLSLFFLELFLHSSPNKLDIVLNDLNLVKIYQQNRFLVLNVKIGIPELNCLYWLGIGIAIRNIYLPTYWQTLTWSCVGGNGSGNKLFELLVLCYTVPPLCKTLNIIATIVY